MRGYFRHILHVAWVWMLAYVLLFMPWTLALLNPQGILRWIYTPQVFFLIASISIIYSFGMFRHQYGLVKPPLRYWGYVAILSLGCFGFLYAAHTLLKPSSLSFAPTTVSPIELLYLLVLAPVTEELFFRGIVFQQLLRKHSLPTSMILSSLLFMGTHGSLWAATFALGLIASYWTYKSRSILPAIGFHVISNTFVLFAHNVAPNAGALQKWLFW